MRHRTVLATALLAGCGWWDPAPAPDSAPVAVLQTPDARFQGTWRLDAPADEDLRLDALDQILGGGPVPTDAQWSDADRAWLIWAAEVHARPETDVDRVALERFAKERAERRLVVDPGGFTVKGVDGSWSRSWKRVSSVVDPQGRDILYLHTREEHAEGQLMVRFEDPDHIEVGPAGKPDQLVRWARVSDPT